MTPHIFLSLLVLVAASILLVCWAHSYDMRGHKWSGRFEVAGYAIGALVVLRCIWWLVFT